MIKKVALFFSILFCFDMLTMYIMPEYTLSTRFISFLNINQWYYKNEESVNYNDNYTNSSMELIATLLKTVGLNDNIKSISSLSSRNTSTTTIFQKKCGYITWSYTAAMGLGNRMFIYASLYGTAKRNNKIAYITDVDYALDKMFNVSILPNRLNLSFNWMGVGENGCCRYVKNGENLPCDRNVNFWGYRQSYKYFDREDIKREFAFLPLIENKCMDVLTNISIEFNCSMDPKSQSGQKCIYVGAHMRRGDFTDAGKQNFGHSPATVEYLRKAVNYFDAQLSVVKTSKIVYVILGNDYAWNLESSKNITNNSVKVLTPDTKETDLCVLTKCNHTIISAGSYSWWAAYLAGGNVTYMKNQCRPGSSLCSEFTMEDYINPEWPWVAL